MITEKEIKDALRRSGYLIESRVAKNLSELSFFVEPNITFFDEYSKKSREIDLLASSYNNPSDLELELACGTNFVIETINNSIPIVFFKGKAGAYEELENKIRYMSESLHAIDDFLINIDYRFFHYWTSDITTQYCSFQEKKKADKNSVEWMAMHPDDLYETFRKLLFCTEQIIEKWKDVNKNTYNRFFRYQPLLVLSDYLIESIILEDDIKLIDSNLLVFEFSYSSSDKHRSVYIDVITEKYLEEYINIIRNEDKLLFNSIKKLLLKNKK